MLQSLRLQNFRSYADSTFEFKEGVTIIVGPNASGKTNLLEAIQYISTGSSYRVRDAELVMFETEQARLEAHTTEEHRVVAISLDQQTNNTTKEFVINTQHYKRLSAQKQLPVVLFEPDHLRLLHAGPEHRREFLDNILAQTTSGYSTLLRNYRRALAQRNSLLKSVSSTGGHLPDQLFAWNIRLSELGGAIAVRRAKLVELINESAEAVYQQIAHTDQKVRLQYKSACLLLNYSTELLKQLEAHTQADIARGFTAYGPHRDDLVILLENHDARDSASRGEIRTLLLTLKVLEMRIIEEAFDKKPLLLLDDVFSELDGTRRKALTYFLRDRQTFISTTDADVVVQHFMNSCTIIPTSRSS